MTEQNRMTPPSPGSPGEGPAGGAERYARMPRVPEGRILAGVCTGLGRRTGIDPVIFRVAFALLLLAGGQGGLLYLAAVLLMPVDEAQPTTAERWLRRRFDAETVLTILGGLLCACVVFSVTGSGLVGMGMSANALTVVVLFALVLLVAHARRVDLVQVARTLPERLQGHPPDEPAAGDRVSFEKASGTAPLAESMIDLATLPARTPRPPGDDGPTGEEPIDLADRPPHIGETVTGQGSHSGRPSACRASVPGLTSMTLLAALMTAAVAIPASKPYGWPAQTQIVLGSALAVVGLGLVIGCWTGRGRGLTAVGAILSLCLVTSTAVGEAPREGRYGDVEWRPTEAPASEQIFRVIVGSGKLDLTALRVGAGQRVSVDAEVIVGELNVMVPRTTKVEVDARAGLGDVTVDGKLTGGPNAKVKHVLEPETGKAAEAPMIMLRIRSKFGDMDVRRA